MEGGAIKMKVSVVKDKKNFTPVQLVIYIESQQELANLWHRFSLDSPQIYDYKDHKWEDDCADEIWDALNSIAVGQEIPVREM